MADITTPEPVGSMQASINSGNPGSNAGASVDPYTVPVSQGGKMTSSNPVTSPSAPITSSALVNTTPVNVPDVPNHTDVAHQNAMASSQNAILGLTGMANAGSVDDYNSQKNDLINKLNTYAGMGADQLKQEQNSGTLGLKAAANTLNNKLLTSQATYADQYNKILNDSSMSSDQQARQISALQQNNGFDLTKTAIQASIAGNLYTNAQNAIDHQIELKYAPLKTQIDYGMQFLSQNKDLLSAAQTRQFTAQLQVQQQTYTQGVYDDHLTKDTQVQMIKDAAANNAPSDITKSMGDAMLAGKSIGDVAQIGGQYLKQTNYTPIQTGIDPNTGIAIYSGYDQKTNKLVPMNPNNTFGVTGSNDTTVEGYQLGATTSLGAYASNTKLQVGNVKNTVAQIKGTVGNISDATTAQTAISNIAPNSPITGEMVMESANRYGIKPSVLIGVMQAETQLGTDKSKGSRENNWGNVGNTDNLMKSGGSVKMKPQEGVDAVARNLAMRTVKPGQIDPAQPDNGNFTPMQKASMIIKNAPTLIQSAMGYTLASGEVFIDDSKLSGDNQKFIANSYVSQHPNIPRLSSDQVETVRGADEAIRNIVDVVAPAWQKLSPSNLLMKAVDVGGGPIQQAANTDFSAESTAFKDNTENLAQQIKALSKSAPKLGLLGTAEKALPNLNWNSLDTTKVGNLKMQKTLDLLNETIKTYIPNASPVVLSNINAPTEKPPIGSLYPPQTLNGVTYTADPKGKYSPQK